MRRRRGRVRGRRARSRQRHRRLVRSRLAVLQRQRRRDLVQKRRLRQLARDIEVPADEAESHRQAQQREAQPEARRFRRQQRQRIVAAPDAGRAGRRARVRMVDGLEGRGSGGHETGQAACATDAELRVLPVLASASPTNDGHGQILRKRQKPPTVHANACVSVSRFLPNASEIGACQPFGPPAPSLVADRLGLQVSDPTLADLSDTGRRRRPIRRRAGGLSVEFPLA
ncbi:hypothetical protein C7T35_26700 [Variovorax sp. WS11]|nr:hypothetical protein C7T35_26700 [Variovorax sp. WS11]